MLDKRYDPRSLEDPIIRLWEEKEAFRPSQDPNAPPYCLMMPPPNVTGSLHIGHALNQTLQDILARFERLRGKAVLWQPGTDHAGIATQMVVERELAKEGLSRQDLGREAFIERVWAWKKQSGGHITRQLRRLGTSCDWGRERFTLDERLSKAVCKVFVRLYKDGLMYRDKRLVNWDPHFQTALSDLEVDMRDVEGKLWHVAYPLAEGDGEVVIATTRPETMLGDMAVAVHPDDDRYRALIGQKLRLPLTERLIPIIADEHADPEQGTGAVKITPAHDFNDFEVGQRHDLDMINIFDERACITAEVPEGYRGLDRFEARAKILTDLETLGLLRGEEKIRHAEPFGDRSGVVLEPYLTDQWFVDTKTLAQPALEAVKQGKTDFIPRTWEKTYFSWMNNIEPWCISRQLWWGHRIPAWYGPDGHIFVEETEEEALKSAEQHYGTPTPLRQDEDVLDTWFSSGLWPFSTLGWPEETEDLQRFYPTSTLVTAFDIIFFWVARMMMQGLYVMGDIPFHQVYIHALVRDEKGQKMSKSKGNTLDPLELIDSYGADALRFTMAAMAAQGRDVKLSEERVAGYRNFATKIWNAARFLLHHKCRPQKRFTPHSVVMPLNKWLVVEIFKAVEDVTQALETFRFNEAAGTVYHLIWGVYCDWYLESIKTVFQGEDEEEQQETRACAAWAFDQILKLLHPFMPFLSEALWKEMAEELRQKLLIRETWPEADTSLSEIYHKDYTALNWVMRLIRELRSLRAEVNIPPSASVPLTLVGANEVSLSHLKQHSMLIEALGRISSWSSADAIPEGSVETVVDGVRLALSLQGVIDVEAEKARLEKAMKDCDQELEKIDKKLKNESFLTRAPASVVEEQRARRRSYEDAHLKYKEALQRLTGI